MGNHLSHGINFVTRKKWIYRKDYSSEKIWDCTGKMIEIIQKRNSCGIRKSHPYRNLISVTELYDILWLGIQKNTEVSTIDIKVNAVESEQLVSRTHETLSEKPVYLLPACKPLLKICQLDYSKG